LHTTNAPRVKPCRESCPDNAYRLSQSRLDYMKNLPPTRLASMVQNLQGSTNDVHRLETPAWLTAQAAPTDWAIIAKQWDTAAAAGVVCNLEPYPLAWPCVMSSNKKLYSLSSY